MKRYKEKQPYRFIYGPIFITVVVWTAFALGGHWLWEKIFG